MPPAQATLFATEADVAGLLSQLGLDVRLDDDNSGSREDTETDLLTRALEYGTAKVKLYGQPTYSTAQLATSWLCNEWAALWACEYLCSRRLNSVPDPVLRLLYGGEGQGKGALGDMEDLRQGKARLPDVGRRNVDWPLWSNINVDPRYRVKQIRVQRPISERTPPQYPQTTDRVSGAILEQ